MKQELTILDFVLRFLIVVTIMVCLWILPIFVVSILFFVVYDKINQDRKVKRELALKEIFDATLDSLDNSEPWITRDSQ